MSAGRTSTTPATSPAMSGLRLWSSYSYISLSGLLLFLYFYLSVCVLEVTVTSLHPPRLCRIAVFSVKPTFPSRDTRGRGLRMCVTQASATRRGGRCSNNNIAMRTSLSSVPFGLPLWTSLFASYQPEQVHHRSRVISMKVTNIQTLLLGGVAGSNGPSVLDT